MKNLIYTCVFKNPDYINLLYLWIKSLCLYGNVNTNTTDILIITSQEFANIICERLKEFESYRIPIFFHTYENINCIMQACSSRLQIFNNGFINSYSTILYLDTDILINNDINKIFNLNISHDKIYATKTGYIGHEYWGAGFFDFDEYDKDLPGLCSGALLFKNSPQIKGLFSRINDHIWFVIHNDQNKLTNCYDQPFINYTAIKENMYDNELLNEYIINDPRDTYERDIVIYHFLGGLGDGETKYGVMVKYMERMER